MVAEGNQQNVKRQKTAGKGTAQTPSSAGDEVVPATDGRNAKPVRGAVSTGGLNPLRLEPGASLLSKQDLRYQSSAAGSPPQSVAFHCICASMTLRGNVALQVSEPWRQAQTGMRRSQANSLVCACVVRVLHSALH